MWDICAPAKSYVAAASIQQEHVVAAAFLSRVGRIPNACGVTELVAILIDLLGLMILERNRIDAQGFECMYLAGLSNAVLVGVLPETKFCPYGGTG